MSATAQRIVHEARELLPGAIELRRRLHAHPELGLELPVLTQVVLRAADASWLIFLLGYFPFFAVSFWVYDMPTMKKKLWAVGTIFFVDIVCLIVFLGILKWI